MGDATTTDALESQDFLGALVAGAHRGPGALVQQMIGYQQGRLEAFELLYQRLAPQLRNFLRWRCLDENRADDLLQEAFLQLHRSRHTYQPPRPVEPWAFAIARNVFRMDCRTRHRRPEEPLDLLEDLPIPAEAMRVADRATVCKALAGLDIGRREAVLLHHLWGFSFREVGDILGISSVAAKVRAHRGRKELQAMLRSQEQDPSNASRGSTV